MAASEADPGLRQAASDATDLYLAGHRDDAIGVFRSLVKQAPHDPYLLRMLGSSLQDSDLAEAESWFLRAADAAWEDPVQLMHAAFGLADVLQWASAKRVCDRIEDLATDEFPERVEFEHLHGRVLAGLDRPHEALPHLQDAYEADPTIDNGNTLAQVYLQLDMYERLASVIQSGFQRNPDDSYLREVQAWVQEHGAG